MDVTATLSEKLTNILEHARFAPSVHNTQPWKVALQDDHLLITFDPKHLLHDGDPTGRQTYISLGIFAEAIAVSAATQGLALSGVTLHDKQLSLSFSPMHPQPEDDLSLLHQRCTDRSIYQPVDISEDMKHTITASSSSEGAHIHVITDREGIATIASLTARGIRVALSNPSFRKELSQYLTLPWSGKKRGIAVSSLHINPLLAACEPVLMRFGVGLNAEAKLERRRWESASGIIAITTPGDMSQAWLEAGRAYLRVSLAIERLGLAQATSAATVEASNYHTDVETLLNTSERLQSVIRIGKGTTKKFSPRISVSDLLT